MNSAITPTASLPVVALSSVQYVIPPTPPVTRFEPAASCLPSTVDTNNDHNGLWLSKLGYCSVLDNEGVYGGDRQPDWIGQFCDHIKLGEPDVLNKARACYNTIDGRFPAAHRSAYERETSTYNSACPVGYTTAGEPRTSRPFDTFYPTPYRVTHPVEGTVMMGGFDVTKTSQLCCPTVRGLDFKPVTDESMFTTHTDPSEGVFVVYRAFVPNCFATDVPFSEGEEVTLNVYDGPNPGYRGRTREGGDDDSEKGTKVVEWKSDSSVFAEGIYLDYTVFHGTHTCYTDCTRYLTESYFNTDPNYTPPPPATSTPEPSTSSISSTTSEQETSGVSDSPSSGPSATGSESTNAVPGPSSSPPPDSGAMAGVGVKQALLASALVAGFLVNSLA